MPELAENRAPGVPRGRTLGFFRERRDFDQRQGRQNSRQRNNLSEFREAEKIHGVFIPSVQFSSVQSLTHIQLFATP